MTPRKFLWRRIKSADTLVFCRVFTGFRGMRNMAPQAILPACLEEQEFPDRMVTGHLHLGVSYDQLRGCNMLRQKMIAAASLLILVASMFATTNVAYAGNGKISMKLLKAAFIIGGSGGKGTLIFQGKSYPLRIGGLSAGWQITLSAVELRGNVENIGKPQDIEGIYSAAEAGLAIATGAKTAVMVNSKGVRLAMFGVQMGVDASLNLQGLSVKLAR